MALPLSYNVRSVAVRWKTALVGVLGIAGTVGVMVAMLAMATGFQATLVNSGSPENALVRRAGASSELESVVTLESVKIIGDAPGVARSTEGAPLVSGEVVVIAAFPLLSSGTDANVQVRGVSPRALEVRPEVKITAGRMFSPGLSELVVGRNVPGTYQGLSLGDSVKFGGATWNVVGVFDAGGSAFDSEPWCDATVLNQVYKRPENIFQSVTVRLITADSFEAFKDALTTDPRLNVQADRETAYYASKSRAVSTLIRVLGLLVTAVMAVGAVFGALNTMYAAVSSRTRELATIRALGFGTFSIMLALLLESLLIAAVGGALGCLAALPLNGFTTGTMNWQTFSHLAFAFRVTPVLMAWGMAFALFMGLLGGILPAIRAARLPVAAALREL
jgi:putative ABC transport system permease protein